LTTIRCRRCSETQPPAFFCRRCEAIQLLPQDADYLAVLGLPMHPAVDPAELERRYYDLSRKLHPDRFQIADADDQQASVQATALLNAAYRTLRDVESRGRWWLERSGESLGRDNNRVPPALAAYVFDVQEKLAELKAGANGSAAAIRSSLVETQQELGERRDGDRAELDALLHDWPEGDPATGGERTKAALAGLKSLLSELSYLRTLERDLQSVLEA
jgi:molecular chaperone HscB